MKPATVKGQCSCGSQPLFIIHSRRNSRIGYYRLRAHPPLITPNFYRSDIAQLAAVHHFNGIGKMLLTSLPLSCLHHPAISLLCCYHSAAFFNRVTYRLFYIHIFSGFTGMNHHKGMPVIGGANDNGINVFIIQQSTVIGIFFNGRNIFIFCC